VSSTLHVGLRPPAMSSPRRRKRRTFRPLSSVALGPCASESSQMSLLERLRSFDRKYGHWVLPVFLSIVVVFDWAFPMRGSSDLIEEHRPDQLRICVGFTLQWDSRETEVQRFYFLAPFSFSNLMAVGVHRSSIEGLAYFESRLLFLVMAGVYLLAAIRFAWRRDNVTSATEDPGDAEV